MEVLAASNILKITVVTKLTVHVDEDMRLFHEIHVLVARKFQHLERYELEVQSVDGQVISNTTMTRGRVPSLPPNMV
ncbi:hypothetical protein GOP47_0000847 [Adiantum capillus-veneris]|uniref:Uncharacterized protein n=1 Tax=Adiantum capillus-veneris TaxID=13818 RepID=A0A9D4VFQ7_ADICA|nr:hypothetical protein GOP47_0000847 [Adiantum capillus-veneris]